MPRTITRTGLQRASLAADAGVVADLLVDPAAVTALLGDLLDQRRSRVGPPARWTVPRISLGLATFDTVLLPSFERVGDVVHIRAVATPDSDARATVDLRMQPQQVGPGRSRLVTTWQLELGVPLPRAALRMATPAIDRTVASTVQTIMRRTEAAAVAATDGGSQPA